MSSILARESAVYEPNCCHECDIMGQYRHTVYNGFSVLVPNVIDTDMIGLYLCLYVICINT